MKVLQLLLFALTFIGITAAGTGTAQVESSVEAQNASAGSGNQSVWDPVPTMSEDSSPDYAWKKNSISRCLITTDPAYNDLLHKLGEVLFRTRISDRVGCITNPYLASAYSQYVSTMENHAGLDFKAQGHTVFSPVDGTVVFQGLDQVNGKSTLTIETSISGVSYIVLFLHCRSHEHKRGDTPLGILVVGSKIQRGDQVCVSGDIGARGQPHLHIEVKRSGHDSNNLEAMSGRRGACVQRSFSSGYDRNTRRYDRFVSPGCSLAAIRENTVDPTVLVQVGRDLLATSQWEAERRGSAIAFTATEVTRRNQTETRESCACNCPDSWYSTCPDDEITNPKGQWISEGLRKLERVGVPRVTWYCFNQKWAEGPPVALRGKEICHKMFATMPSNIERAKAARERAKRREAQ